jgi:hypothetical protein
MKINKKFCPTYIAEIFLSGSLHTIEEICRKYCLEIGLCVTVEPTKFIYTGGAETGARIGLTNYPRFPKTGDEIWEVAIDLGYLLLEGTFQHSVLIRDSQKTLWLTNREV